MAQRLEVGVAYDVLIGLCKLSWLAMSTLFLLQLSHYLFSNWEVHQETFSGFVWDAKLHKLLSLLLNIFFAQIIRLLEPVDNNLPTNFKE